MTYKEKLLLFILCCVNFTHIMDFMIMMPLGPQLMKLFDINPQQFGFAVSAYSITAGGSGFAAAFFADRFDRKQLLSFAYVGFVIGTFACAFAPSYLGLVAARVLAGFFGGMIGAQVLSIVGDTFEYERRGRAMGVIMTAFSFASVAGVPTGLWLASHYSWHAPFLAVGILGVMTAFLIFTQMPPMTKHLQTDGPKRSPLHVLTDIAQTPNQQRALLLSGILMLGHFSIIPFFAPALVGNAGFDEKNIFLIYLVGGALTIFTAPLVGRLADKYGKFRVFATFAALSVIPIWFITNLQPTPLWTVLVLSGLFFVFTNGRMIPMQAIVSGVTTPQQRGGFMGINSALQQLASGLAATIGGVIIHKTPDGHLERYAWVGYFALTLILSSIYLAKRVRIVGSA